MSGPVYMRTDDALWTEVDEDIVALHINDGACYGMESVTADIWRLLGEPIGMDDICNQLLMRYDVELDRCRMDTGLIIQELQKRGLVQCVE